VLLGPMLNAADLLNAVPDRLVIEFSI